MRLAALVLAALPLLAGCLGTARLDDPDAGRTTRYEPGVPSFDVEAVGRPRGDASGIDLYAGVAPASLVFVESPAGGFEAAFDLVVRLLDRRGRELIAERAYADTIRVPDYAATRRYAPHHLVRRLDVAPGDYVVEVTLTDRASEASAERRLRASVVAPGRGSGPDLAALRLEARRGDEGYAPVVALHVPRGLDSLRAVAALTAGTPMPVTVTLALVRFESDTTAAVAPYRFGVGGALAREGVRFSRADTLQRSRRRVEADGTVELLFALPSLEEGVYRAEVTVRADGGAEAASARTFSITAPAFPRVETFATMVGALRYLALPGELEALTAEGTEADYRRRFDAFWGGLVPDRARAADLVERYYSRVEEANRLFTSYKAGWKTDRGMVYIVLGPPLYVDRRVSGEVWHYAYGTDVDGDAFVFERLPVPEGGEGFAHYALERGPGHDRLWMRALERWRSGRAL